MLNCGDFQLSEFIKAGYIIVGEQTVKIESHNNIKIMTARSIIASMGNVVVELIHEPVKLNVAFVPRSFNAPPILLAVGALSSAKEMGFAADFCNSFTNCSHSSS